MQCVCGVVCRMQKPDSTPDVAVGELIALIVEPGEDWKNVPIPVAAAAPSATVSPAAPVDSAAPVSVSSAPES